MQSDDWKTISDMIGAFAVVLILLLLATGIAMIAENFKWMPFVYVAGLFSACCVCGCYATGRAKELAAKEKERGG